MSLCRDDLAPFFNQAMVMISAAVAAEDAGLPWFDNTLVGVLAAQRQLGRPAPRVLAHGDVAGYEEAKAGWVGRALEERVSIPVSATAVWMREQAASWRSRAEAEPSPYLLALADVADEVCAAVGRLGACPAAEAMAAFYAAINPIIDRD